MLSAQPVEPNTAIRAECPNKLNKMKLDAARKLLAKGVDERLIVEITHLPVTKIGLLSVIVS